MTSALLRALLVVAVAVPATACDDERGAPPAGGDDAPADARRAGEGKAPPAPSARLPAPGETVLPNGARVWLLHDDSVPLVTITVDVRGGAFLDDDAVAGRTALLAEVLQRGAGERGREAFAAAVEETGGRLSVSARPRSVRVEAEFLSEDAERGLALVADVVTRPRFAQDEVDAARRLLQDGIRALRSAPNRLVDVYDRAWCHPGSPLGAPVTGTVATLAKLDAGALRDHWARSAVGGTVVVALAGDFDGPEVLPLVTQRFGTLPKGAPPAPPAEGAQRTDGVLLVDKPDAIQTYFRFGGPGVVWADESYPARLLANTVLGGRFTSRLNTALRIEAGLTYGARSSFDDDRGGRFRAATYTATASTAEAIAMAREVVAAFVRDGLTAEELESARAYVTGQYAPDRLETPSQRLAMLLALDEDGLSRDHVEGLFARLAALTLDDVNAVVRARFPAEPWTWTLVGRADEIAETAAALGEVTRVPAAGPGFGPR